MGRFLELSLGTPDIRASIDFYARLGFSEAQVGETWAHPYAVLTDGRICLGLHQQDLAEPVMTFVKPGLLKHLYELESRGIEFAYRNLGNDKFNEVGWKDPDGWSVRLIEARTFSPSMRPDTQTSRCGYFLEIALPCADLEAGKRYWERLGFVGMDEIDSLPTRVVCTSDFLDIGLYQRSSLHRVAVRFESDDIDSTLKALSAVGVSASFDTAAQESRFAMVVAPEGTPVLIGSAS